MLKYFAYFFMFLLNCAILWTSGSSAEQLKTIHSNELTTPVVEYFLEHQVTETEARKSTVDFVENGKLGKRPQYCDECTSDDKHYCNSQAFISDHCCCDHRQREKLPWVPHTCYLATKGPCIPHHKSCMKYIIVKECCCDKILFDKWRHTFSHSPSVHHHQIWKISTQLPMILIAIIISSHSILFAMRL